MATITKGNPFTHHEETRESIAGSEVYGGCDWCGRSPRTLYNYDGSAAAMRRNCYSTSPRWFCNKGCHRAFYG